MLAPPLILALLGALLSTHLQKPSYQATAQFIANRDSTVLPLLIQPPRHVGDFMRAEALTARSPGLAARVVAATGVPGMSTGKLLAASAVTPAVNFDLLRFSVSDTHSRYAVLLANTYASEFARLRTERESTGVSVALRSLNTKIEALQAKGATTSPAYSTLLQQRAQLKTLGRLLSAQVSVLQPAEHASAFRTHTLRNSLLGGALGGLLGIGLVAVAALWLSRKHR
jgi:uncharacterized protein involved in exopolysaccharide biosynthesis